MNRLQLCQRAVIECGAGNVSISSTTSPTPTGEALRFVNWVDQAWQELQTLHDDWEWMRSSNLISGGGVSFVPAAGQPVCAFGTNLGQLGIASTVFGKWCVDSFRNYPTSVGTSGEVFMTHIKRYDAWRDSYMYGSNRSVQTRPIAFAVGPNFEICVGPPSDGTYTVTGDYYTAPAAMAQDADTPTGLPPEHHIAIVFKVMEYYAGYEAAPEVMGRASPGWSKHIFELERLRGPRARLAGALA